LTNLLWIVEKMSTGKRRRGVDDDINGNVAFDVPDTSLDRGKLGEVSFPALSAEEIASATWLAYRSTKSTVHLTPLELGAPLSAVHIALPGSRLTETEQDLSQFVKAVLPTWKRDIGLKGGMSLDEKSGDPVVLIICPSADRAASLLKPLAAFHVRVFKGFARHLSLADAAAQLSGPPVQFVVGTPQRLARLLETKILTLSRTKLVVLDMLPDIKRFSLLDHPSLQADIAELFKAHILPHVIREDSACKLALFPGVPSTLNSKPPRKPKA
jgi:hypothetical protein